jgi:transposase InsO family protein
MSGSACAFKTRFGIVLCCSRQVAIIRRSSLACSGLKRLTATLCQKSFGQVNRLPVTIEWLSDNGSCYVDGDTRSFARDIGLEPRTTPLESPQSDGMAEAFVRTIKRDYVRVSPRPDAETVMRQLPAWIAHYNDRTRLSATVHPVSSSQRTQDPDRVRSFGGYNRQLLPVIAHMVHWQYADFQTSKKGATVQKDPKFIGRLTMSIQSCRFGSSL